MIDGNTAVFFLSASETGNPYGSRSEIYLHGNLIAEWWYDAEHPLGVEITTLARWPTATTKSRLRALGADVRTIKGRTILDGVVVA